LQEHGFSHAVSRLYFLSFPIFSAATQPLTREESAFLAASRHSSGARIFCYGISY
jgi:hypothetical protein